MVESHCVRSKAGPVAHEVLVSVVSDGSPLCSSLGTGPPVSLAEGSWCTVLNCVGNYSSTLVCLLVSSKPKSSDKSPRRQFNEPQLCNSKDTFDAENYYIFIFGAIERKGRASPGHCGRGSRTPMARAPPRRSPTEQRIFPPNGSSSDRTSQKHGADQTSWRTTALSASACPPVPRSQCLTILGNGQGRLPDHHGIQPKKKKKPAASHGGCWQCHTNQNRGSLSDTKTSAPGRLAAHPPPPPCSLAAGCVAQIAGRPASSWADRSPRLPSRRHHSSRHPHTLSPAPAGSPPLKTAPRLARLDGFQRSGICSVAALLRSEPGGETNTGWPLSLSLSLALSLSLPAAPRASVPSPSPDYPIFSIVGAEVQPAG